MVEPAAKSNFFFFLLYLWTILIVKLFFCGAKKIRMYIYAVGNQLLQTAMDLSVPEFLLLTKAHPKLRTSKAQ